MNIVEALKLAKEQGKKVRPVGVNWCVVYEDKAITGFFVSSNRITTSEFQYIASAKEILMDWEVVWEKPSKETQYKIDSMKFQIVRYCTGRIANFESNCKECKVFKICKKNYNKHTETSSFGMLDDWSLKEIVEAYHILKEAGEI